MKEVQVGWVALDEEGKSLTTGSSYIGKTSKLYKSLGSARSAMSNSAYNGQDIKILPAYVKVEKEDPTGREVLAVSMKNVANDPNADTIGEYLVMLLQAVWDMGEGFSGKRPFGNSGWKHCLHEALVLAGYVAGEVDAAYNEVTCHDREHADRLINSAVRALFEMVHENSDNQ